MYSYKTFLRFRFASNSSQPAIINQRWKMLANILEDESLFLRKKKLIEPKKIAETFTFFEKEMAKLYTATSFTLNTSLYLEFN